MKPPRWNAITESEFPWEREALDFVRERLPDRDPYRAWTNFEFIADDGSVNEVDAPRAQPDGLLPRRDQEPARGAHGRRAAPGRGTPTAASTPTTTRSSSPTARPSGWRACSAAQVGVRQGAGADAVRRAADLPVQRRASTASSRPGTRADVYLRGRPSAAGATTASSPRSTAVPNAEPVGRHAARRSHSSSGHRRAMDRGRHPPLGASIARSATTAGALLVEGAGYQDWDAEHVRVEHAAAHPDLPLGQAASAEARADDRAPARARVPDPRGHRAPGHPQRPRLQGARARPGADLRARPERAAPRPLPARARSALDVDRASLICARSPRRSATRTRSVCSTAP